MKTEAVWPPHPGVWGTKINSVRTALRLGPISIPTALSGLACAESQPVLAPCWLCLSSVFKGTGAPHWDTGKRGDG